MSEMIDILNDGLDDDDDDDDEVPKTELWDDDVYTATVELWDF